MAARRHVAKAAAGVRPGTVLDRYTEVYGVHKGAWRAAEFAQLVVSYLEAGREESASEYGRRWGISQRQAFHHRQHAAEVFGDEWRDVVERVAESVKGDSVPTRSTVLQLAV